MALFISSYIGLSIDTPFQRLCEYPQKYLRIKYQELFFYYTDVSDTVANIIYQK